MEVFIIMKKILAFILIFILTITFSSRVFADSAINNGIAYLGTNLDGSTGQIINGYPGDASPWAAIAFSANGTDPSTVKSSDGAPSLVDYLKNNPPTTSSAATEWEKWILALVASGQDVSSYISTLKSTYYIHNQIEYTPGDTTDEASDWFGILALIANGDDKADPMLTNTLRFILANQNCDGGFGYAVGASSDGNDTAAAVQALADAKKYSITNLSLDNAIANAKAYLLTTQDPLTGGFLYDTNPWTTAPDTDSTTWALMALNVLGMQNSQEANNAKTWLTTSPQQQSITDGGGFTSCQYNAPDYTCQLESNTMTTSHALIGLIGKSWVLNISNSSDLNLPSPQTSCVTPTPTDIPTVTPTDTPTPTPSSSSTSSSPTVTPTPTPTLVPTATPTPSASSGSSAAIADATVIDSPTPMPTTQNVLGASTQNTTTKVAGVTNYTFPIAFIVIGFLFLLAGIGKIGYNYFWRK